MKKKLIALTLIFAMLVPLTPAVAADDTSARPTVEEILSDYHQAAFEAETSGEASASTYSRSGSAEQTLEQQTVNTLNEAGYEAYNVTADNYDMLEEQLQSDFSEMGLDRDGSYIVVIHGEEENSTNGNARLGDLILPPHQWEDDSGTGNSSFTYTYNGTTYTMRYVTITASEQSELGRTRAVDLFTDRSGEEIMDLLELPIEIFTAFTDYLNVPSVIGTSYTLLSLIGSTPPINQSVSLAFTGSANWTIKYTQVFDAQDETWKLSASVEYVTKRFSTTYAYYSDASKQYEYITNNGDLPTEYSKYYNDTSAVKDQAALAFENNGRYMNKIEDVTFEYNEEVVLKHTRWSEGIGYEPQ